VILSISKGKAIGSAVLFVAAVGVLWVLYPGNPSLITFAPEATAQAESGMWRAYYEKQYIRLFLRLYGLSRYQSGFSPLDSLRIAVSAARAAQTFQPTTSRTTAFGALPFLKDYYSLLAKGAPVAFSVEEVSRLELEWWQARREHVAPESYGLIIARTWALLYGTDNDRIRAAGVLRAKAMTYRDAREEVMSEADWESVTKQLLASYQALKEGIGERWP
jgi:hypothetical protein